MGTTRSVPQPPLPTWALLWATLLPALASCSSFRPPPAAAPESQAASQGKPLWNLPLPAVGTWLYERREVGHNSDSAPSLYVKQVSADRQIEGALIARRFLPLDRYLRRPWMTPEQMESLPKAPLRGYAAIIVELERPMSYYPARIQLGDAVTESTAVDAYDRLGRKFFGGTLDRVATAEGYEDVTCPAGEFKRCKRLRIDLHFRFPWNISVDTTEYRWFADGLGEVRRLEHFTAVMWIFWMDSAYDYTLVSFLPHRTSTQAATDRPRDWWRAAALFDRTFPRPRISGIHAELVDGETVAPSSQPATQPADRRPGP